MRGFAPKTNKPVSGGGGVAGVVEICLRSMSVVTGSVLVGRIAIGISVLVSLSSFATATARTRCNIVESRTKLSLGLDWKVKFSRALQHPFIY
jgi:hypothetical protein